MIAIISFPEDPHAMRVLGLLREAGEEVELLDLSMFPDQASLTMEYGSNGTAPQLQLRLTDRGIVSLDRVDTIWWRRPQATSSSAISDPDVQLFVANEWNEALNGLWQLLRNRRWVNDLVRDEVASRKALQLRVAAEEGLRIPKTLMTSDPEKARAFIDATGIGKTIFKTFSCTYQIWRETRLVRQDDLEMIESVRLAPTIFQEYVPGDADLRITAIGKQLFPVAIRANDTDYPVDFRMSLGQAVVQETELPGEIATQLHGLMAKLGLVYGAIDMRRTPEGEYVFLEVNTAGEFLFVEERTSFPISRTLAELLASRA